MRNDGKLRVPDPVVGQRCLWSVMLALADTRYDDVCGRVSQISSYPWQKERMVEKEKKEKGSELTARCSIPVKLKTGSKSLWTQQIDELQSPLVTEIYAEDKLVVGTVTLVLRPSLTRFSIY